MTQEQVKEFQKFLQDRGALEEWIHMAEFDAGTVISEIINSSFEWIKSRQGFAFWSSINDDWEARSNFTEKEVGMTADALKKLMYSSKARKVLISLSKGLPKMS
ncbi:MAG: hypothetical protein JHC33_05310 [Ignisphaera sp.]|nr:hypothetical protein [Ignisphaera sp.]